MFKIFSKKVKEIANDESIPNTYPKEVLQIHNEFNTAADKLLNEARSILNSQPDINPSKIETLKNLGFTQTSEYAEAGSVMKTIQLSNEQIERINYYKRNYPLNKFISEKQVEEICHKYNLVCGGVSRFKGFVPQKNLNEIANFKLKDKDKGLIITTTTEETLFLEQAEVVIRGNYAYICKIGASDKYNNHAFLSDGFFDRRVGVDFYSDDEHDLFGLAHKGRMYFTVESDNLQICAPIKDMDISGLELKNGYKLNEKINIPDPIVLQPVKDGYLILTAWGDEASDPLVVNEIYN